MKKKIDLKSMPVQYFIGFVVNIIFLLVLISFPTSYSNLQVPEGQYSDNCWQGSDVVGYVRYARNFLENGVFGRGETPTMRRTIGFPFYLATLMKLFPEKWLWAYFICQAVICAFSYPLITGTTRLLFPERAENMIVPVFLFSLISSAYITRLPVLCTDTFFAVIFMGGVYYGFKAIVEKSWFYLLLQVILIGYASLVRPSLIVFPIINVLLLLTLKEMHNVKGLKTNFMIIVSALSILVVCNLSSVRNYVNYGLFKPTDVLEYNLFNYMAKNVLISQGKSDVYENQRKEVEQCATLVEKMELQKKHTFEAVRKYPAVTVKYIAYNAVKVLLGSHWQQIGRYWYLLWRDFDGQVPMKKSYTMLMLLILGILLYLALWFFFAVFMIYLLVKKRWLFFLSISLFVSGLVVPAFIGGGGARMRLPVEWLVVICSFYFLLNFYSVVKQKRRINVEDSTR